MNKTEKRGQGYTAWDTFLLFGLVRVVCWPWASMLVQVRVPFTNRWFKVHEKVFKRNYI